MSNPEHTPSDMSPEERMREDLRKAADAAGGDFEKLAQLSKDITDTYEKTYGAPTTTPKAPSIETPQTTKPTEAAPQKNARIQDNFQKLQSLTNLESVKQQFEARKKRLNKNSTKEPASSTSQSIQQNTIHALNQVVNEIENKKNQLPNVGTERMVAARTVKDYTDRLVELEQQGADPVRIEKMRKHIETLKTMHSIQTPDIKSEKSTASNEPILDDDARMQQSKDIVHKTIEDAAAKALADIDAQTNALLKKTPDYLRTAPEKTPAALVAEARAKYLEEYEKSFKNKSSFTRSILNFTHASGILRKDKSLSKEARAAKDTYEQLKNNLEEDMRARLEKQNKSPEQIEKIMKRYRNVATGLEQIEKESGILNKARAEAFAVEGNKNLALVYNKTLGWYSKKFTPQQRKAISLGIAVGAGFMTGGMSTAMVGAMRVVGGALGGKIAEKVGNALWKQGVGGSYEKRLEQLKKDYMAGTITPSEYQQRKEGLELLNNRAEALKTTGVLAAGFGSAAGIGQIPDTAIESLFSNSAEAAVVAPPAPEDIIEVYEDKTYKGSGETPTATTQTETATSPATETTAPAPKTDSFVPANESIEGKTFDPLPQENAPAKPGIPELATAENVTLPVELDSSLLSDADIEQMIAQEQGVVVEQAPETPVISESTPEALDLSPEQVEQLMNEELGITEAPQPEAPAVPAPTVAPEPILELDPEPELAIPKENPTDILEQPVIEPAPEPAPVIPETPITVPEPSFEADTELGLETAPLDPQTEKLALLNQYFGKHDFVMGDYLDPKVWTPQVQDADAGIFLRSPQDAVPEQYKAFHTDLKALTLKYNIAVEGRRIDDVLTALAEAMIAEQAK